MEGGRVRVRVRNHTRSKKNHCPVYNYSENFGVSKVCSLTTIKKSNYKFHALFLHIETLHYNGEYLEI